MKPEEAIKVLEGELKASLRIFGEKNDKETQDALRMAIEALKDRPHGKWIPCSERLPEHMGYYLVTTDATHNHVVDIAEYAYCWRDTSIE